MGQSTAIIGVGHTITVAAGKEDTGGAFALLDYELAPGFSTSSLHIHHREDVATYVLEGRLLIRVGETERLVGPGEFVFLHRGIEHAQSNPGPEPARFLVLLIPAGFEQFFPDLEALLEGGAPLSQETIGPLLALYGVQPQVLAGARQDADHEKKGG
ncbi:MAG TPA: cupin domain-containing protein [Chloroflexota bacterium]|jgi:quercetin dioxygenase-like cupin family protein